MGSWSLSWVSVDGIDDRMIPGIEIYQGGYAKCPPASVGSCPWNFGIVYYWYYYAREQGVCGSAFNTGIVDVGNAATGTNNFKIRLDAPTSMYRFTIDDIEKNAQRQSNIDQCWHNGNGITGVEWQSEMLNDGDSPGGTTANTEKWSFDRWQNGGGWHDANKAVGPDNCDANSYPTAWECEVLNQDGTGFSRQWKVWDNRD